MIFRRGLVAVFYIIFFIIHLRPACAQDTKKKSRDFFNLKAPSVEYLAPESGIILFEEDLKDSSNIFYFTPERESSMLEEEEPYWYDDEDELNILEVAEQMKMDCVWVTIAEYYAIWDSRTVNPYKIDGANFKDSLNLVLYDSLLGFRWSMPLTGCHITSEFGMRHSRWHYGTDLRLQINDPVLAAFDGIVRICQYDRGGYGYYVLLRHYNGMETLYGHLSKQLVKVGQLVKAGEIIGLGGNTGRSTGPHLHFEVRYEGNAIDPEEFYDFENNRIRNSSYLLTPAAFNYLKTARQVFYHTVRSGETLGSISRKYKVPVDRLCRLNGITTKTILKVGRRLRIR